MDDFPEEFGVLRRLRTPGDIQDFLNGLKMNFSEKKHTYSSPLIVLKEGTAHCMEGAMLAAAALWHLGRPPLILDLKTAGNDVDHVLALFKEKDRWGAITKTNHVVLRYRDPVYRDPRELAMSYFNEYFLDSGVKTMRSFSAPFDLSKHGDAWITARGDQKAIVSALDHSRHFEVVSPSAARRLRRADPIEIKAGKLVEWRKDKKRR
jgi:hypothetical protein